MRPLVLVSGPPATRSGYGAHARDLIHALIEMDRFDIHINSLRWGNTPMNALNDKDPKDKLIIDRLLKENTMPSQPDIHFQISVPNEFSPIGKYNIGVTAGIENTTPKAEWLGGLNRMDMNVVSYIVLPQMVAILVVSYWPETHPYLPIGNLYFQLTNNTEVLDHRCNCIHKKRT